MEDILKQENFHCMETQNKENKTMNNQNAGTNAKHTPAQQNVGKHTPGEWIVGAMGNEVFTGDGKATICQCVEHDKRTHLRSQANARLIAAAPDLLEACKEMINLICDYNQGEDYEVNGWIKEWGNIVKKAEGK